MPYFIVGSHLYYFAHVPKAAGSTVENYLEARFGPLTMLDRKWLGKWVREGRKLSSIRTSPQHLSAKDAEMILPAIERTSFAIVRDPTERLLSEYRFQTQYRPLRHIKKYLPFSVWLHAMITAVRLDRTIVDNHLRPQIDIVPKDAHIFPLEKGLKPLTEWLDAQLCETSSIDINSTHELATTREKILLSKHGTNAIIRFYGVDYETYGYTPPSKDDASSGGLLSLVTGTVLGVGLFVLRRAIGLP